MKKSVFIIAMSLVFACFSAFADDAVVTYVSGKVEVNRNNTWIGLKSGDVVHESEILSTGFKSEAKIKYNNSILSLGPLTRINLEQLSKTSNSETVNVYLNTGAVRSNVNHSENVRANYTVRSAVAVASVRGTVTTSYADGYVSCDRGSVEVVPASLYEKGFYNFEEGPKDSAFSFGNVVIGQGQKSKVDNEGNVKSPMNMSSFDAEKGMNQNKTAKDSDFSEKEQRTPDNFMHGPDSNVPENPLESTANTGSINVSVKVVE